jgi:hypothetical protein
MWEISGIILTEKKEVPGVKPVKYPFYSAQILHELAWNLILLSAANSR